MADDNSIPQYPNMFDPSQFSNKYSAWAGKPLNFMGQYAGVPTDALGRPIQSYLDAQNAAPAAPPQQAPPVTLNSTPQQAPQQVDYLQAYNDALSGGRGQNAADATRASNQPPYFGRLPTAAPQQQQAPQAAAPSSRSIDMSQAYLNALSNPGKVTTGGATVPQAPTPTGQSNVLQQFLQNWQNKGAPTTGAGNYNNAGFFNALQGTV